MVWVSETKMKMDGWNGAFSTGALSLFLSLSVSADALTAQRAGPLDRARLHEGGLCGLSDGAERGAALVCVRTRGDPAAPVSLRSSRRPRRARQRENALVRFERAPFRRARGLGGGQEGLVA